MPGRPRKSSASTPSGGEAREPSAGRRTGRRPGESHSQQAILQAARELFAEQGYPGTTVRAIARKAGVDPALVHYFFTNKEGVYGAVVKDGTELMDLLGPALEGGAEGLAERLVPAYLRLWDQHGETLTAIFRTTAARGEDDPVAGSESADRFVSRLAAAIGGRGAKLRAALILAQLEGLATHRYVFKQPPLATASPGQVVRWATESVRPLISP